MTAEHRQLKAAFEKLCDRLDRWQLENDYETRALREVVKEARTEAEKK
jgi:hypothetical protein